MSKNKAILNHLRKVESATLSELYNISDYSYYCNWESNFGKVMSRLVKSGFVVRIKPGLFKLAESNPPQSKSIPEIENQVNLF